MDQAQQAYGWALNQGCKKKRNGKLGCQVIDQIEALRGMKIKTDVLFSALGLGFALALVVQPAVVQAERSSVESAPAAVAKWIADLPAHYSGELSVAELIEETMTQLPQGHIDF